ncbi:MAG TPA: LAGLIDADG family homing endonuclease [Gaiellaceae bacterium]|nr:LAGLIDADG family homing endonuclease [Gaiellaceae bacterium]
MSHIEITIDPLPLPRQVELAWAAGLFEGEGHFTVRQRGPRWRALLEIGVTSTDRDVIERFAAIVGTGNVRERDRLARPHWKRQFYWTTSGHAAHRVADMLLPMLSERRRARHAEIAAIVAASQPQPRACEQCDAIFTPSRFSRQRFCSSRCCDRAKYLRRKAAA